MPALKGFLQKEEKISPQDVRNMLGVDNREIVSLCKQANISPRKSLTGQIYFSKKEFDTLKQIKNRQNAVISVSEQKQVINNLMTRLDSIEKNITDSIAKTIDEKLEGMDEVVVELIRCKTENENLKNKINELNKENFYLKNTLNTYKPLFLGLYVKRDDDFII